MSHTVNSDATPENVSEPTKVSSPWKTFREASIRYAVLQHKRDACSGVIESVARRLRTSTAFVSRSVFVKRSNIDIAREILREISIRSRRVAEMDAMLLEEIASLYGLQKPRVVLRCHPSELYGTIFAISPLTGDAIEIGRRQQ
jgi:hypothetical protein